MNMSVRATLWARTSRGRPRVGGAGALDRVPDQRREAVGELAPQFEQALILRRGVEERAVGEAVEGGEGDHRGERGAEVTEIELAALVGIEGRADVEVELLVEPRMRCSRTSFLLAKKS